MSDFYKKILAHSRFSNTNHGTPVRPIAPAFHVVAVVETFAEVFCILSITLSKLVSVSRGVPSTSSIDGLSTERKCTFCALF